MISYQDDHSRFITGSVKIWSPTGENAILLLEKAVKRYGVPEQILTDQGTQFKPARGGTSEFAWHCQGWELSISLPACAGPQLWQDRSVPQSLRSGVSPVQGSTGASYATTTT